MAATSNAAARPSDVEQIGKLLRARSLVVDYPPEVFVTCEAQFQWTSASCSHAGLVRPKNEDACLDKPEQGIWVVADGMGGHAFGELASSKLIEALTAVDPPASLERFVAEVRSRLQHVNRQLRTEAQKRNVPIIGSTAAVLLAHDRRCCCLWAGDSRIYLYRDGALKLLTRDHSQVEELRAMGNLAVKETLLRLPRNTITRAVGAADTLELDEETLDVSDGDMFLLCSDGLSNEVSEQEMQYTLLTGNCQQASEALVDLALDHGGHDNISAVVVRAEDLYSTETTVLNPAL